MLSQPRQRLRELGRRLDPEFASQQRGVQLSVFDRPRAIARHIESIDEEKCGARVQRIRGIQSPCPMDGVRGVSPTGGGDCELLEGIGIPARERSAILVRPPFELRLTS